MTIRAVQEQKTLIQQNSSREENAIGAAEKTNLKTLISYKADRLATDETILESALLFHFKAKNIDDLSPYCYQQTIKYLVDLQIAPADMRLAS